jgi:transposase
LHGSWELLPQAYGNVHTVYVRFVRWVQRNAWEDILRVLEGTPNAEHLMRLIQNYRDNACRRKSVSTLRRLAQEMKAKYGR